MFKKYFANNFIKIGVTASNILLADGSDITQSTFTLDSSALHKTGNETKTGVLSFVNTGVTFINGIDITNNGTNGLVGAFKMTNSSTGIGILINNTSGGSGQSINNSSSGQGLSINNSGTSNGIQISNNTGDGINITNSTTGNAITFFNSSSGYGLFANNSSTGRGVFSNNSSTGFGGYFRNSSSGTSIFIQNELTGKGLVINNTLAATGHPLTIQKNSVDKLTISDDGLVTGSGFVKSGVTASNILLAGGSDIPQSTFAPISSPSFTGIPTAPTATVGTNTTQIATTAFVLANGSTTTGNTNPNFSNVINSSSTSTNIISYTKIANISNVVHGVSITPTSASTLTSVDVTIPYNRTTSTAIFLGTIDFVDTVTNSVVVGKLDFINISNVKYSFTPTTTNPYKAVVYYMYNTIW